MASRFSMRFGSSAHRDLTNLSPTNRLFTCAFYFYSFNWCVIIASSAFYRALSLPLIEQFHEQSRRRQGHSPDPLAYVHVLSQNPTQFNDDMCTSHPNFFLQQTRADKVSIRGNLTKSTPPFLIIFNVHTSQVPTISEPLLDRFFSSFFCLCKVRLFAHFPLAVWAPRHHARAQTARGGNIEGSRIPC